MSSAVDTLKQPLWAPGLNMSHNLSRGLACAMPVWDRAGTRLTDYSGNGLHGTLTNMDPETDWVVGRAGLCLDYDGSDDLVTFGNTTTLNAVGLPTTHGILFRLNSLPGASNYLFAKGDGFIWAILISSSQISLQANGSQDLVRKSVVNTIVADTWHHAIITWDGSSNYSGIRIYLSPTGAVSAAGGQEVLYDTETNGIGVQVAGGAEPFTLGNRGNADRSLDGQIALAYRYNRVLEPGEIAELLVDPWAAFRPPTRLPMWVAAVMPFTGYRLYRGIGGLGNVDFDTIIASTGQGATSIEAVAAGHAASTRYTYVLRPVINNLESPEYSCQSELVTDSDAEWIGARPGPVEYLTARVLSGGQIELRWRYVTPYGGTAPASFNIYYGSSPNRTADGSPEATETYTKDGGYIKTITLTNATTYYFAVTAKSASAVESRLSDEVGPLVADSAGPATPVGYVSATF